MKRVRSIEAYIPVAELPPEIWSIVIWYKNEKWRLSTAYAVCRMWTSIMVNETHEIRFGNRYIHMDLISTRVPRIHTLCWNSLICATEGNYFNSLGTLRTLCLKGVSRYGLKGYQPFSLTALTNLTDLDLSYCGAVLPLYAPLRKLSLVHIDPPQEDISRFTRLESLCLKWAHVPLVSIAKLTSLRHLTYSIASPAIDMTLFYNMAYLDSLEIEYTSRQAMLIEANLSRLDNLTRLVLNEEYTEETSFKGECLQYLTRLTELGVHKLGPTLNLGYLPTTLENLEIDEVTQLESIDYLPRLKRLKLYDEYFLYTSDLSKKLPSLERLVYYIRDGSTLVWHEARVSRINDDAALPVITLFYPLHQ